LDSGKEQLVSKPGCFFVEWRNARFSIMLFGFTAVFIYKECEKMIKAQPIHEEGVLQPELLRGE
jgi:hypothetical protein